jgi:ribonuclease HII
MFAAAVVGDPDALPAAVADSKSLTQARREALATEIAATPRLHIGLAEVTFEEIDAPETDMNTLTVAAHARALTDADVTGETGRVDAGDVNAERFGRRVEARVGGEITVQAEHGADERHPLVSAASVIAKVARDAHVAAIDAAADYPVGSGYPSDERTRRFLETHVAATGELPDCARRSWQTSADVLERAAQTDLGAFD